MNLLKVLVVLLLLVLAAFGAFALFGVVMALLKWALILGVILLAGVGAYKLLSKPDAPRYELGDADAELMKTERLLEELRRKQLTK